MNILFFTRLFYPHIGGVETHVMRISRQLVNKGNNVIVVTENHGWKKEEIVNGINIIRVNVGKDNWFKKFRIWSWLLLNYRILAKADIVHCHDVFFWFLPFKLLYWNKPVYVTFHGYETVFPPTQKAIKARKYAEGLSFGNICVGEYITKWYGTEADIITYGAADVKSTPKDNSNDKLRIAFVGRIEKDNGIEKYLRTFDLLKQKKLSFNLVAYGDGSLREHVKQYGKVYGFVNNVEEKLKNVDIILASSYLSILSALALKKPVISVYDNQLKKDYLEMTPFAKWIYIAKSPEELANQIEKVIKNGPDKKKINEAYEWVKHQTWEKLTNDYYKLWGIK